MLHFSFYMLSTVLIASVLPSIACQSKDIAQHHVAEAVGLSKALQSPATCSRLWGGYIPKKSRKSKSKRKTLRLKYNIQKKVRSHLRKTRKQQRKVEKEKIRKRKLGLIPDKLPVHSKDDVGWILRSHQLPGTSNPR